MSNPENVFLQACVNVVSRMNSFKVILFQACWNQNLMILYQNTTFYCQLILIIPVGLQKFLQVASLCRPIIRTEFLQCLQFYVIFYCSIAVLRKFLTFSLIGELETMFTAKISFSVTGSSIISGVTLGRASAIVFCLLEIQT